jgi:glycosyltransferase involved in cell wall biosynthesis
VRVAALSWRYLGHPAAGGAEVVTHEILSRLAADGHRVVAFTAAHAGGAREDEIDGVRVVRRGGQATVHLHAWRWLRGRLDEFDRVVDQINTIPFFTPLYVPREQRRFWIQQLAREYWWRETRGVFRAIAPVGYLAEPLYLRAYRRTPGMTISESSRRDLEALGIRDVAILPLAHDAQPLESLPPRAGPPLRIVIVGRLTPAKFVEEAITAFAAVREELPEAQLDIVGTGDPAYRARLERRIADERIGGVMFHGRVDVERKHELMERAHMHLFTSHREGWGLVVSEAGALGTPSLGYDAPGVRDSVGEPRLLALVGDTQGLADRILWLWRDGAAYEALRRAAWERARGMSVDAMTAAFARAIGAEADSGGITRDRLVRPLP